MQEHNITIEGANKLIDGIKQDKDILPAWEKSNLILDGLHPDIISFIKDNCKRFDVTAEYVFAPMIAAVSILIGPAVQVQLGPYTNRLNVWVGLVAESSSNKSTVGNYIAAPLRELSRRLEQETSELYKSSTTNDYVVEKCLIINDATDESRKKCLSDNPRGIIEWQDELTAFIDSMGKYTGTQDFGSAISCLFEGDDIRTKRIGRYSPVAIDPYFSLYGTIQPHDILRRFFTDYLYKKGFTSRFLLFCPVKRQKNTQFSYDQAPGLVGEDWWCSIVNRLYGSHSGSVLSFSEEAKAVHSEYYRQNAVITNATSTSDYMRYCLGKLDKYFYKIAGLIHVVNDAVRGICSPIINEAEATIAYNICKYNYAQHYKLCQQSGLIDRDQISKKKSIILDIVTLWPESNLKKLFEAIGEKDIDPATARVWKHRNKKN